MQGFEVYGLTPPQTLSWMASQYAENMPRQGPELPYLETHVDFASFLNPMEMVVLGLILFTVAAAFFLWRVMVQFAPVTGRLPLVRSQRPRPAPVA
jgi:hypothetical protein